MKELLDFVERQVLLGMFIGLNTSVDGFGEFTYTVDYWENETQTNELGEEVEIRAGRQMMFTL